MSQSDVESESGHVASNPKNDYERGNYNFNAAKGFITQLDEFESDIENFPENPTQEDLEILKLNLHDLELLLRLLLMDDYVF